jgi:hypothetical protein
MADPVDSGDEVSFSTSQLGYPKLRIDQWLTLYRTALRESPQTSRPEEDGRESQSYC